MRLSSNGVFTLKPAVGVKTFLADRVYASWKDRKALASAIKPIYTATSVDAALSELDSFEQGPWGQKFPTVVKSWRSAWRVGN